MTKYLIIWILWWSLVFLLECLLTIITIGFYLYLTPSNKLLISRADQWYTKKMLLNQYKDDPMILEILHKSFANGK